MTRITKQVAWEMAHRLSQHASKCRSLHGHHYKLEVTVEGPINAVAGTSDEGMVLDFGWLKALIQSEVLDVCDHACMVWDGDAKLMAYYADDPTQKHVIVPFQSTAENIARWIFSRLYGPIFLTGCRLALVKVWETPCNSTECDAS